MFELLDSPSVTTDKEVTIRESESETLNCTASGNPTPKVGDYNWTLPNGTSTKSKTFKITGAKKGDTGHYRCNVRVRSDVYGLLNGSSDTIVTIQCKYLF